MKTILKCVVLYQVLGYISLQEPDCSLDRAGKCSAGLMVISKFDEVKIPENKDKLIEFCSDELEADQCSKDYIRDCLSGLPRQLAGIWVDSATRAVQGWCRPNEIDGVVESLECIVEREKQLKVCMDDLVDALDSIVANVEPDDQLPQACCLLSDFRNCIRSETSNCDENTVEFADSVIDAYASDAIQLACAGFEAGSERCHALPEFERIKGTSDTIFIPLLTIIKSL